MLSGAMDGIGWSAPWWAGMVASRDVTPPVVPRSGQALNDPARSALERVAAGEAGAVADCVARYGSLVWALARRLAPDEADDAVQEIFIDLWRSAARFDPAVQPEATFVAMIARRRLIDRRRLRQRRPPPSSLEGVEPATAATNAEVSADAARALRVIDELRPAQREVLVLSAVQGFSHEEIARQKSLPLGTVKAHARRALLRVRAALLGDPPGDEIRDEDGEGQS